MKPASSPCKVGETTVRHAGRQWWLAVLLCGTSGVALAQESPLQADPGSRDVGPPAAPSQEPAAPEDLEPAVDTSAEPAASGNPGTAEDVDARSGQASSDAEAADPPASAARYAQVGDRIELEATQITGNRELPKVLYIVPWKRSDLGDVVGKPVNSLLDEVLMPVDRDVFRRENRYYRALAPDAPRSGAAAEDRGAEAARSAGAEK